jgi:hypothetical protein
MKEERGAHQDLSEPNSHRLHRLLTSSPGVVQVDGGEGLFESRRRKILLEERGCGLDPVTFECLGDVIPQVWMIQDPSPLIGLLRDHRERGRDGGRSRSRSKGRSRSRSEGRSGKSRESKKRLRNTPEILVGVPYLLRWNRSLYTVERKQVITQPNRKILSIHPRVVPPKIGIFSSGGGENGSGGNGSGGNGSGINGSGINGSGSGINGSGGNGSGGNRGGGTRLADRDWGVRERFAKETQPPVKPPRSGVGSWTREREEGCEFIEATGIKALPDVV